MTKPTILIVDDEEDQRDWVRNVIEGWQPAWAIQEADCLESARRLLYEARDAQQDIRIAVVDLNLSQPMLRAEGLKFCWEH